MDIIFAELVQAWLWSLMILLKSRGKFWYFLRILWLLIVNKTLM